MFKRTYYYSIKDDTLTILCKGYSRRSYSIADVSEITPEQANDTEYCKRLVEDTLFNMGYISEDEQINVVKQD